MLDCIRDPEIATEITLQPFERFDFDGAIIFADILNILIGMGLDLDFKKGVGPVISNPIASEVDVAKLVIPKAADNVQYTLDAIGMTSEKLKSKGIPVLGFSGAPFTLACYAIEGGSSKDLEKVKGFMFSEEDAWDALLSKLSELVTEYLVEQIRAGASAVQLFDSWAGYLSPYDYERRVLPHVISIVEGFRKEVSAPLIFFSTGTSGMLPLIRKVGADAVGVDWRIKLGDASNLLGGETILQGNMDPILLTGSWEPVEEAARRVLKEGKALPGHVFNVGHGVTPRTKIDNVKRLVDLVREEG